MCCYGGRVRGFLVFIFLSVGFSLDFVGGLCGGLWIDFGFEGGIF